jgi:hypothetical protein
MSLVISKVFTYDTDAGDYIQRVEGASGDNQALEPATRQAINNFVIGCKQDGIWNAIKASCILSGARTLAGALQPLAGTAPTPVAFVSGDYNRKTGLVGDGTTKYLNSNRAGNADPQSNTHLSLFLSTGLGSGAGIGRQDSSGLNINSLIFNFLGNLSITQNCVGGGESGTGQTLATGFVGASRSSFTQQNRRVLASTAVFGPITSEIPPALNYFVFCRNLNGSANYFSNARIAFYSIGESLDLALLDARVSNLISAFGVAIP